MSLDGDWPKLRRAIAELAAVDRTAMSAATDAGTEGVEEQYHGDFDAQRDPWGKTWAATKTGKSPVLVGPTFALYNAQIGGASGTIRAKPERYWAAHQAGAHGMAERSLLPFSASRWDKPIQDKIESRLLGLFTTND